MDAMMHVTSRGIHFFLLAPSFPPSLPPSFRVWSSSTLPLERLGPRPCEPKSSFW